MNDNPFSFPFFCAVRSLSLFIFLVEMSNRFQSQLCSLIPVEIPRGVRMSILSSCLIANQLFTVLSPKSSRPTFLSRMQGPISSGKPLQRSFSFSPHQLSVHFLDVSHTYTYTLDSVRLVEYNFSLSSSLLFLATFPAASATHALYPRFFIVTFLDLIEVLIGSNLSKQKGAKR